MKNKNLKLGLVSSSSLILLAGCATTTNDVIKEKTKEESNIAPISQKLDQKIRSVINFELSKDNLSNINMIANPENNEIIISADSIKKDFAKQENNK